MDDRNAHAPSAVSPLKILFALGAAGLYGFLLMPLMAEIGATKVMANTAYRGWQVLIVIQATLWIFAVAFARHVHNGLRSRFTTKPGLTFELIALVVIVVLPVVIQYGVFPETNAIGFGKSKVMPKGGIGTYLGFAAAVYVGLGILRIHAIAASWAGGNLSSRPTDEIGEHRALSRSLEGHVLWLGMILAMALVGTQASRIAVFELEGVKPFPARQIPIWGAYYSLVLAVIYGAARSTLQRVGANLRHQQLGEASNGEAWEERSKREEGFDKLLKLRRGLLEELQSLAKVVTPFVGALASNLLGA